ncbi:Palmitoyl-protein thioesterase 1 [Cichlidogyrus casuarinus]|uniref:Palmitoyl-protein thioesterase 1 n=1 Tax=Cichlidogyrus casuarinus TaxID=1844966 RepID=A0ABD2QJX4_9PLAT
MLLSVLLIGISLQSLSTANPLKEPLPVLLWHGMGDSGFNTGMQHLAQILEQSIPGLKTKQVTIGSNKAEVIHFITFSTIFKQDIEATYFVPVQDQLKKICSEILANPLFDRGIQFLGLSQGGLFARALVQSCPLKGQLGSLISVGGPQQGIYGFPACPGGVSFVICRLIDKMLSEGAYLEFIQSRLVQAQYWHDPLNKDKYETDSLFLAGYNQEQKFNKSFAENMKRLKNLVLVKFNDDQVVVPRESEHFGYFHYDDLSKIYNVSDSPLYKEDQLGLKSLDESGRLHLLSVDGDHLQFNLTWFKSNIIPFFE